VGVTTIRIKRLQNSYTAASVVALVHLKCNIVKKTNAGLVKPEEVKAIELGYRSLSTNIY
jgi:hypothetical protein